MFFKQCDCSDYPTQSGYFKNNGQEMDQIWSR